MCGIAGICRLSGSDKISFDTLVRMTGVLCHRGPDETGIYIDEDVGLGHARLSIIDLAGGVQPIHNEDETIWIVYNGEVFNYVELRAELVDKGHRFYTTSDTEVIVHLYEEYGVECLNHLNGQFAMAIWDARKECMFLARDRMGIRPLHYTEKNGMLIFSSEIKSIFQHKDVQRKIDPLAMDEIFTFWTTLGGRTAFKDVYELEPGHYMTICRGEMNVGRYWDIPYYDKSERLTLSPHEISEKAHDMLHEAVRIRLRADVPVASYLSGGLDSSGLTSLVVKNFNKDVRTFGIRFEEDAYDEGTHQQQMVSYLGAKHCEIHATNEKIGAALPDVLWHGEKPVLRTSPIPLYLLSKLVRESGLKVVLTGEGADEVFGGYNIFREAKIRRFWSSQPNSNKRADLIGYLYPYIFQNQKLKSTLQHFFAKGLNKFNDPLFSHSIRWGNTSRIKTFFSHDLKKEIGSYDGFEEIKRRLPEDYDGRDYLAKAQYLEMSIFMSNYLLSSQGDRMAMANSVEIRLPYLDPNVVDFMGQVPSKWKILGLNEKHLLKKVFKKILPETITTRSKHPYRAPITQSLLRGKAGEYAAEMMSEKSLKKSGLFDTGKTEKLLAKIKSTGAANEMESMALVGILSSQLIHLQFVEEFPVDGFLPDSIDLLVDRRV
ncbi:MAG: asparagine synthase (glutamine-hydrolyzing) [Planctomycetes bacterium]|nr:asparagine synthase (glutamine-hydrolyzing) [Planctomycetota bacterium]